MAILVWLKNLLYSFLHPKYHARILGFGLNFTEVDWELVELAVVFHLLAVAMGANKDCTDYHYHLLVGRNGCKFGCLSYFLGESESACFMVAAGEW